MRCKNCGYEEGEDEFLKSLREIRWRINRLGNRSF
jgi:hypothetical protein